MKAKDLTNKKFGKLLAILPIKNENGRWKWLCKCDCGSERIILVNSLINGNTNLADVLEGWKNLIGGKFKNPIEEAGEH